MIIVKLLIPLTLDLAAIGVLSNAAENLFVQINIVRVHGSVKCHGNHLRYIDGLDLTRDSCTISGTETIGQTALSRIALRGSVGIAINSWNIRNQSINSLRIDCLCFANLQQAFSSEPSLQSGLSSQKSAFSIHSPFPQDNLPSGQMGSSVFSLGRALRGPANVRENIFQL